MSSSFGLFGGGIALVVSSECSTLYKAAARLAKAVFGKYVWVCDGTADDVEIQAAISAIAGKGVVHLTSGTFYCAAIITIPDNNLVFEGCGYSTIVKSTNGLANSINVTGSYCILREFYLNGNNAVQLRISGSYVEMEHVYSYNHTTYNLYTTGNNNRFKGCWFLERRVRVSGGAVEFYACNFNGNGTQICVEWDASGSVYGCTFETYLGNAIRIADNATVTRAAFIGNYFETSEITSATINVSSSPAPYCLVFINNYDKLDANVTASLVLGTGVQEVIFVGNNFRNGISGFQAWNGTSGIKVGYISDHNGTITFNTLAGLYQVELKDNGRSIVSGAAAPGTGTWKVGDICWNTAPIANGAPGWVCTTAGTPGTWKSMANLAA